MRSELKAKELVESFKGEMDESYFHILEHHTGKVKPEEYGVLYNKEMNHVAKQCASRCVQEIIISLGSILNPKMTETWLYWQKVKEEINKL